MVIVASGLEKFSIKVFFADKENMDRGNVRLERHF